VAGRAQLGGLLVVLVTGRRDSEPTVAGRAPQPPPPSAPAEEASTGVAQLP